MKYPAEQLTEDERARLAPFISHQDRPVFALLNLPETVKGALFARYSRYAGTLQRLLLDEFADSLPEQAAQLQEQQDSNAAGLYDRIFLGYGDDSVAQLGGMHVAAEWCSNILTKILQRPRIGAYLEQSTRYIAFDKPVHGLGEGEGFGGPDASYRYYRDPELIAAAPGYVPAMDELFGTYATLLETVTAWCHQQFPAEPGTPEAAHNRAIKAKALDLLRGLLPASTLSHVGIYASGQTYEQLIMHLLAHPLPEARQYGRLILESVQAVMPSFVTRVERPERGGRWIEYFQQREQNADRWAAKLGLDQVTAAARADQGGATVKLISVEGSEDDLLAGMLFEQTGVSEVEALAAVRALDSQQRAALMTDLVGDRENRRHRPGRGFERVRYRFEIVSDYGAFRDLQRHRMLTVQWQTLTPTLGAEVPAEVREAGGGDAYQRALDCSATAWQELASAGLPKQASYAVSLGYRMRYVLDLNARAAMQLIELRSGREGHPTYRAVAHEMQRLIGQVHPSVAAAMSHVDLEVEPRLERVLAEIRNS